MDEDLNNNVVCCFCGESLFLKKAIVLTVQPNIFNEEKQQLFCHRKHLVEKINRSIFLHPDIFNDEDE